MQSRVIDMRLIFSACSALGGDAPPPAPRPTPPTPTPVDPAALPRSAYDPVRDGFVVHEWGTFTSVRGSDGALLPCLHHQPGGVAARGAIVIDGKLMVRDEMPRGLKGPAIVPKCFEG